MELVSLFMWLRAAHMNTCNICIIYNVYNVYTIYIGTDTYCVTGIIIYVGPCVHRHVQSYSLWTEATVLSLCTTIAGSSGVSRRLETPDCIHWPGLGGC